ncbi:CHAP domain-containing protein [Candidatus Roizmanbacteria bacterium]|nr:CHAP domain-containing protein [Candidatus Roizmanbacteria bacterium]
MRRAFFVGVVGVVCFVMVATISAANEEELLKYANKRYLPESQQNVQEEPDSFLHTICQLLLLCEGAKTQSVVNPQQLQPIKTEQDKADAEALMQTTREAPPVEETVQGTSSAQVLAEWTTLSDLFSSLFSGEEKTGFIDSLLPASQTVGGPGQEAAKKSVRELQIALLPAGVNGIATPTPTPASSGGGGKPPGHGSEIPPGSIQGSPGSIRLLAKQTGDWAGVPWQVMEALMIIEGSSYGKGQDVNNIKTGLFKLTSQEVTYYQQPGMKVPNEIVNCSPPNSCSAAGPVQFTIGVDNRGTNTCSGCGLTECPTTWYGYKDTVLEVVKDGRTPEVCNLKDSVYAAARMMKKNSGTAPGLAEWKKPNVVRSATSYYGSCEPCATARPKSGAWYACQRLGEPYCEFVWNFYREQIDTQVVDPSEGTQPGTQPGAGATSAFGKLAEQMVNGIKFACVLKGIIGRVTGENVYCLDSVTPKLNQQAYKSLQNSAITYNKIGGLQCVGFVRGVVWQVHNQEIKTGSMPAASYFAHRDYIPVGYTLIKPGPGKMPKPGELIVWGIPPSDGHIAYVTAPLDWPRVMVVEANVVYKGTVGVREVRVDQSNVAGWLTKNP